ncbi:ISL3 family transposase [Aurantimonas aggregata]|uniref:ISL3 family transposase n=1 Tax=Aurantimonas aggregata TaxID=2047720 RepID=A0A6L9MI43_9HYPH|nr:ISL3 family transposase [Aurantimonas aggregata]
MAEPVAADACCPRCHRRSGRVHSRYIRQLADLPWHGRVVCVHLHARRFRCDNSTCSQRIFVERLPEVRVHARRTLRLGQSQLAIGLATGGEPGSRLAGKLAMPVSGDTLLRMIHAVEAEPFPPPRVVGIDDWAWRRGQRYGTIVCDLERNRVIDLLPDRNANTVAKWLQGHLGIEVVARDRAGFYAEGARRGAPQAVQVADRWHLLHNLGEALRTAAGRHRKAVKAASLKVASDKIEPEAAEMPPARETKPEALGKERRSERRQCYEEIRRWHDQGLVPRLIAPLVGMDKRTVERWLAAGGEPEYRRRRPRNNLIDPFRPYLDQRWREGCRTTPKLLKELGEQGFTGSLATVGRWTTARRLKASAPPGETEARKAARWQPPSTRQCAWMLSRDPATLDKDESAFLTHLFAIEPKLSEVAALGHRFAEMIRNGQDDNLDPWLADAAFSDLGSFAVGIGRDLDAVRASMTHPWSTSPVEGQINRLKVIKRQMYGRAHYPLLKQRVLAAA